VEKAENHSHLPAHPSYRAIRCVYIKLVECKGQDSAVGCSGKGPGQVVPPITGLIFATFVVDTQP
jgi:hypothetical protein